jgi:hypothetical protein
VKIPYWKCVNPKPFVFLLVPLDNVKEVRVPGPSSSFLSRVIKNGDQTNWAFSIVYVQAGSFSSLDLVALNEEEFRAWTTGLGIFLQRQTSLSEKTLAYPFHIP